MDWIPNAIHGTGAVVGSLVAIVGGVTMAVRWARRVERNVDRGITAIAAVEKQLIPPDGPTLAERVASVEASAAEIRAGQVTLTAQQTELGRKLVDHMAAEQRQMRKISGRLRSLERVHVEAVAAGQAGSAGESSPATT